MRTRSTPNIRQRTLPWKADALHIPLRLATALDLCGRLDSLHLSDHHRRSYRSDRLPSLFSTAMVLCLSPILAATDPIFSVSIYPPRRRGVLYVWLGIGDIASWCVVDEPPKRTASLPAAAPSLSLPLSVQGSRIGCIWWRGAERRLAPFIYGSDSCTYSHLSIHHISPHTSCGQNGRYIKTSARIFLSSTKLTRIICHCARTSTT